MFVGKSKRVVDQLEIVGVVDFLFLNRRFSDLGPELFVKVGDLDKLLSKAEENSLVHHYFCPPLVKQHLFELVLKEVYHVLALHRTVVSESFQQLMHFLSMHPIYSVLKLGSPPIDTEACSLVRFEVSPERAETVSRHQVVRVVKFVASFELLIDKRVVNSSDCHVVKQMRLVFVLAGVGILIVQVLDVHFHSAIRLLKRVVEKKRVLRPQVPSLRK